MKDAKLWDELNQVLVLMVACMSDNADRADRTRLMEHLKAFSSMIDEGKRRQEERYLEWRKAHRIDELLAQKESEGNE